MAKKTSIAVHITGDVRDFKRAMGEAESSAEKMSRRLSSFGTAATMGVTLPLAAAGGAAIKLFNEQEKAEAKLSSAFKSMSAGAWTSMEALKDHASALQQNSVVGDEAVIAMQSVLLSFGNIKDAAGEGNDVFSRTTQVTLDMAQALEMDLQSAAIQLGKALNDPVKNLSALSRAGIQFTDEQKNLINSLWESGDALGAQQVILEELERQFGGTAAAIADTAGGQMKQAMNDLGDAAEAVGAILAPMISDAASAIGDMAKSFQGLNQGTQEAIVKIGLLAAAAGPLAKLTSWAIKAGVAIKGAWIALVAFSSGGGLVVAAINGIGYAATAAAAAFTALKLAIPLAAYAAFAKFLGEKYVEATDEASRATADYAIAVAHAEGEVAGARGFVSAQLEAADATETNTWATEESAKALDEWREAAHRGRSQAISFHDPIMALAASFEQTQLEASKATVAIGTTGQAMLDALNPVAQLRGANERYEEALAAVQQLEADGKEGTDEYADAMWGLLEATGNVQAAHDKFSLAGVSDDFRNLAARIGLTSAELEAMIALFAGLDGASVTTTKTTGGISVDSSGWSLTRFHDGGVIPGAPGTEVPILAMAGETVLPTHKTGHKSGGTQVIQLVVDGSVLASVVNDQNAVAARRGAF